MTPQEFLKVLKENGAVYADDHVVLTSGKHSDGYVDFDPFYKPERVAEFGILCTELAELFRDREDIDVVVGPETGGGLIAAKVAQALSCLHNRDIKAVTALKTDGPKKDFFFTGGDRIFLHRKRVLVVDDVLTTGSSLDPTFNRIWKCYATPMALGLMVNRSDLTADRFRIPDMRAKLTLSIRTWSEAECLSHGPCSCSVPINLSIGHGREYVAKRAMR